MLKTICYTSLHSKSISDYEIENLFYHVRLFNNKNDIRGVLYSGFDRFFQIIEGPTDIMNPLYDSIKKDVRHTDITEILNIKIKNYCFKEFGTGYNTINSFESLFGLQNYLSSPTFNSSGNADIFLKTLETFSE
jgi:hypothetical protein